MNFRRNSPERAKVRKRGLNPRQGSDAGECPDPKLKRPERPAPEFFHVVLLHQLESGRMPRVPRQSMEILYAT